MTQKEREMYEKNMDTIKTVFDELGLKINSALGDGDDCTGWAFAASEKISVTVFGYDDDRCFSIRYEYIESVEELKEKMKLLLTIN